MIKSAYERLTGKKFSQLMVVVLLGLFIVAGILIYRPVDKSSREQLEFVIQKGSGSRKVARVLAENGVIRSQHLFIFYAILTGNEKQIKAGRYIISPAMNIPRLLSTFTQGLAEPEGILVTIPEGNNIADVSLILSKAGMNNGPAILGAQGTGLEGYLFPDSYHFRGDESTGQIIGRLNDNFNRKARGTLKNVTDHDFKEAIIIASILEKEIRTEEDMRLVSGIIRKRLTRGMPLEIDATVAYGVCYPKFLAGQYCDVSQVNLVDNILRDSEYNTYARNKLPPAPISNPGLAAILAALNPETSDYLYYLNAKDGTTVFSKTGAEHQAARRKYLGR